MSTSIITAPTFTIATTFDVVPVPALGSALPLPESPVTNPSDRESGNREITACDLAAFPRCEWSQRTRCTRHEACQSAK